MIPFFDVSLSNKEYKKEVINSIYKVANSKTHILGKETEKFEKNFANYIDSKYCVGLNSGTDAIELSLRALNISKGDEVITSAHTATATISAIISTSATPVVADITEENFNMNPLILTNYLTKKTKAIVVVHIYGQSCNLDEVMKISKKYNIPIIEDVAQATGAKWRGKKLGSFGLISCFSFYPTKNLAAIGDAGAVITNNKNLYKKLLSLRSYGWNSKRESKIYGRNSRIDELQSSILNIKLKNLDKENKIRKIKANYYLKNITNKEIILPKINKESFHVFHLFVLRTKNRGRLMQFLKRMQIQTAIHYKLPNHRHSFFKKKIISKVIPHITDKLSKEIISLPLYPSLKIKDQKKIVSAINKFK